MSTVPSRSLQGQKASCLNCASPVDPICRAAGSPPSSRPFTPAGFADPTQGHPAPSRRPSQGQPANPGLQQVRELILPVPWSPVSPYEGGGGGGVWRKQALGMLPATREPPRVRRRDPLLRPVTQLGRTSGGRGPRVRTKSHPSCMPLSRPHHVCALGERRKSGGKRQPCVHILGPSVFGQQRY